MKITIPRLVRARANALARDVYPLDRTRYQDKATIERARADVRDAFLQGWEEGRMAQMGVIGDRPCSLCDEPAWSPHKDGCPQLKGWAGSTS